MTKRLLSLILLFVWTLPALAQRVGPININSTSPPNNCATVSVNPSSSSTVYIDVDGTFSATLQAQVQRSGGTAKNVQVTPTSSSTPQATITASGAFWAGAAGVDTFQVCATAYTSGTAVVSLTVSNGVASGGAAGGGGGTVSSITAGSGLTGGTITSSGTIALSLPGSQFAPTYDNGAGALAEVSAPTSPNNVPQTLISIPSGGLATAAVFSLAGVPIRASTCGSNVDTVLAADRAGYVSWSDASACAVTLPQAGSTGFGSNFVFLGCDIGVGTATVTPTTSTISYSQQTSPYYTSGASSLPISKGQCAYIYSDNTNYFALLFGLGAGPVLGTNGGTGGTLGLNGATSGTMTIGTSATGSQLQTTGTVIIPDNQGFAYSQSTSPAGSTGFAFTVAGTGTTEAAITSAGSSTGLILPNNLQNFSFTTSTFTTALSPVNMAQWPLPNSAKAIGWDCYGVWSLNAGTTPTIAWGVSWGQAPSIAEQHGTLDTTNPSTASPTEVKAGTTTTTNANFLTSGTITNSATQFQFELHGAFTSSATSGTFTVTATETGTGGTGTLAGHCFLE